MLKKFVVLLSLLSVLTIFFGCTTTQTGFSPTQNLRRFMIVGEQMKVVHDDADQILGLQEYPPAGKWNY